MSPLPGKERGEAYYPTSVQQPAGSRWRQQSAASLPLKQQWLQPAVQSQTSDPITGWTRPSPCPTSSTSRTWSTTTPSPPWPTSRTMQSGSGILPSSSWIYRQIQLRLRTLCFSVLSTWDHIPVHSDWATLLRKGWAEKKSKMSSVEEYNMDELFQIPWFMTLLHPKVIKW